MLVNTTDITDVQVGGRGGAALLHGTNQILWTQHEIKELSTGRFTLPDWVTGFALVGAGGGGGGAGGNLFGKYGGAGQKAQPRWDWVRLTPGSPRYLDVVIGPGGRGGVGDVKYVGNPGARGGATTVSGAASYSYPGGEGGSGVYDQQDWADTSYTYPVSGQWAKRLGATSIYRDIGRAPLGGDGGEDRAGQHPQGWDGNPGFLAIHMWGYMD